MRLVCGCGSGPRIRNRWIRCAGNSDAIRLVSSFPLHDPLLVGQFFVAARSPKTEGSLSVMREESEPMELPCLVALFWEMADCAPGHIYRYYPRNYLLSAALTRIATGDPPAISSLLPIPPEQQVAR